MDQVQEEALVPVEPCQALGGKGNRYPLGSRERPIFSSSFVENKQGANSEPLVTP